MSESRSPAPWRWLVRLWGWVDASRRLVFNLLFLLIVVLAVAAALKSHPEPLQRKTTLVLDLSGQIAEQRKGSLKDSVLEQTQGDGPRLMLLRDVLAVLDHAAKDPDISQAVLELDNFEGAGLPTLREVAAAIDRFKATGKPVVAWASSYDQRQYFLAAHATQVLMHPMGMVYFRGYGQLRNYYRDALDKLGITAHLIRVGIYKSFAEPYIANSPSDAASEAQAYLNNGLWATYLSGVESARKLPAGAVTAYIDHADTLLAQAGGNAAQAALKAHLVDGLKSADELDAVLLDHGAKSDQGHGYRRISFDDYLGRLPAPDGASADEVGVIVAEGEIVDGSAPSGTVGGLSTAALIRQAREDDHIKALVLRVNSPGGSAFGAELIRRELELTRKAGKPVVVSMGDVAASGGYWIATASDQVLADPATVTGSIGVFALLPTGEKALDKLGVHAEGSATTWLGNAGDPRRALDPRYEAMMQSLINHTYADFTGRVAQARKTTADRIDAVGQGRVWTGAQAKDRGLVDTLGSYGDALKAAAKLAKLPAGYRVTYVEAEPGRVERLLESLQTEAADLLARQFDLKVMPAAVPVRVGLQVQHDLGWLAEMGGQRRPFMALTHCLCTAP